MPEIYAACSFRWHAAERDGLDVDEDGYAEPPINAYWTTQDAAREDAHGRFLAWAQDERRASSQTLRPDVTVWAPARDHPERDALWVLYERAAPRMGDKNREFYPQMRETFFWTETILVREGEPS
jgi:hypothetical protein